MNKRIFLITILFVLMIPICCFAKIYEKVDSQILTSGVTLNNITRFTSNGWLYLNVIEVDMTDSNVKLDAIISENGVSHLSSMKNMANYNNVVAAINADYFAKRADETNRGQAIGFTASDGNIINSSADENLSKDTMSTFILNNDNSILYTFLKDEISLYSYDTSLTSYVADINKFIPLEEQCCIFTPAWGPTTIGNSKGQHMIELVVENNIVTEIRENVEGTSIPENGYVVSGYGTYGEFLLNNFKKGSKIKYDININLDLNKMKMAISGGSILVKDGNIVSPLTHVIYGKHEFTAIGSSKDNNKVYLVTVTNNNSGTLGITQKELATLLKDYGIYNAINLDGGGSTTMVARQQRTN